MNTWDWILLLIFLGFVVMHFAGLGFGMHRGRNMAQRPNKTLTGKGTNGTHQNRSSRQRAHHGCC